MKNIKILSRHSNINDALAAAGFARPMYENSVTESARSIHEGSARHGQQPCTLAFVVEPFSRSAEIYGDKAEVLFVTDADIKLLNRFDINACLDTVDFSLAKIEGDEIRVTNPLISKDAKGRRIIAELQGNPNWGEVYATGL
jgi:hypothetical protein